jgi:hypothetical protein
MNALRNPPSSGNGERALIVLHASVKCHSAFFAPFPTFSAIYWLFCSFCSTRKAMYQFKKLIGIFGGESDRFWLVGKKSWKS